MTFREYDPERDKDAVRRIWRETGWLRKGKEEASDALIDAARAFVAETGGEAECAVVTAPGSLRYLQEDLTFSAVTAVATSRVARKRGLASRLTALAVAADAADGALVSGMGVFDQGYYDRLGFGSGSYKYRVALDPADIRVGVRPRVPCRLGADDWADVHAGRLARLRGHGSVNLHPPAVTREAMLQREGVFGLGYRDGPDGELTHHFWCEARGAEHGPYFVPWMAFQTWEQFLELLALLRGLGDQVRLVQMDEPGGIQLQDLLIRPFRRRAISQDSKFETGIHAYAPWQMRICDLQGCVMGTRLRGEAVEFNLELSDPIEAFLDEGARWRGVAGDYVVTLGPSSGAVPGTHRALPTLRASVNAFTRMWLGVRPASGLTVTDNLSGPRDLLEALDWAFRLPCPRPDWDF